MPTKQTPIDVSVIIVNYNTRELLLSCLKSVFDSRDAGSTEVIVVDNASIDGSRDAARTNFPQAKVIENAENIGFSGANNRAFGVAKGRFLLLLNSDAELRPDGIRLLRDFMEKHPEAGAAGPRLVYDDGTTQPSVDSAPNLFTEFLHLFGLKRLLPGEKARRAAAPVMRKLGGKTVGTYFTTYAGDLNPIEVDCVSGACMIVRREVAERTGGLDTEFFMYMEDMDWCVRMKEAGFKVFYIPEVEVTHRVGASGSEGEDGIDNHILAERYRSRLMFFKKHRGSGALLFERIMMVLSFGARWPFSRRRKAYGRIIGMALSGRDAK